VAVTYVFCLLTVGRLLGTDSCQWFHITIKIKTCTVLSNVTAVLSLKISCCQLHNKITAYSNFDFFKARYLLLLSICPRDLHISYAKAYIVFPLFLQL
jgi:hypothetical protein